VDVPREGASVKRMTRSVALLALLVPMLGCGLQNAVRHLYGASPLLDDFVPSSVFMLSPTEGWVVGSPGLDAPSSDTGIALHLHNGKWSRITIPTLGFDRVFALSPSDVWALDSSTGFYHYDGSSWQLAPDNIARNPYEDLGISDLHMLSPTEGWAVGARIWHYTGANGSMRPTLLRFQTRCSWRVSPWSRPQTAGRLARMG
jgi:hypothetical protein